MYDSGRLILFFNFRPDSRSMILGAFSNIFLLQCRSLDTSSAGILLSGLGFVEHFIFLGVLVRNEPDEFLNKRMNTAPPTDINTGVIWKSNSYWPNEVSDLWSFVRVWPDYYCSVFNFNKCDESNNKPG